MTSRLWWLAVTSCLGMLAFLWTAEAQPGNGSKYALLVGCSKYLKTEFRELPYTVQDVEGFKKALLATGFDADHIITLHDDMKELRYKPIRARIIEELSLLLDGIRAQDTLVLAVSGHGLHFKGDATGYFVPVDGKVGDKSTLIPMEGKGGLFELLKACRAKRKLLIVNACRNDPATDVAFATQKIHLDDEDTDQVPEGIAAIYSCKEGQKSYYDTDRKRAIFFDHVIRAWQGEYQKGGKVTLESFFEDVVVKTKIDVNKTLQVSQVPVVKREYVGEWVISEGGMLAGTPGKALLPAPKFPLDQDTPARIIVRQLIDSGATLFNAEAAHEDTYRLYQGGLIVLKEAFHDDPSMATRISEEMAKAEKQTRAADKAFALRKPLDEIYSLAREKRDLAKELKNIREVMKSLINHGADLFNANSNHSGCLRVYQGGLIILQLFFQSRQDVLEEIKKALDETESTKLSVADRCFRLRAAIDKIRN